MILDHFRSNPFSSISSDKNVMVDIDKQKSPTSTRFLRVHVIYWYFTGKARNVFIFSVCFLWNAKNCNIFFFQYLAIK